MDRADQFREAAARANRDRDRTGWRYPQALRRLAVDHCRERRLEKVSFSRIAEDLGISTVTLGRWIRESTPEGMPGFREVVVEQEEPSSPAPLALVLPNGVRIEGLTLSHAVELARGWA